MLMVREGSVKPGNTLGTPGLFPYYKGRARRETPAARTQTPRAMPTYRITLDHDLVNRQNGMDFGTMQFAGRHEIDLADENEVRVPENLADDFERLLDLDDAVQDYRVIA